MKKSKRFNYNSELTQILIGKTIVEATKLANHNGFALEFIDEFSIENFEKNNPLDRSCLKLSLNNLNTMKVTTDGYKILSAGYEI